MQSPRKIAVAGATGRVGRHAVDVLRARGHDVVAADRRADAIVIGAVRRFRHLAAAPARLVRHACCPAVVAP